MVTGVGVRRILADLVGKVKSQTHMCDIAADLRGHLAHILQRQPLPQLPEPDYSVDILEI